MCLRNLQTKCGAWGPNRCRDIDFPTPLCICPTWPSYQVPMLHPWVCQHLLSSLKCSYVSQKPPKNLVHEALIDAEILTSPLPYIIAQLDPVIRYQCFTCGCANTFQVVWKYSNVSQNSLKKFVKWGPNRCWDIDFPMYLLNLTKIWALMLWL